MEDCSHINAHNNFYEVGQVANFKRQSFYAFIFIFIGKGLCYNTGQVLTHLPSKHPSTMSLWKHLK